MFKLRLNPFYSPDDNATIESGRMSVSDMAEFLGKDEDANLNMDDDTETPEENDKEKEKETPEGEKEKSLEDELEEELKEPTEDEDDVQDLDLGAKRKEIVAKYPNIFKEFPHLDRAVYREQKYSELLPTLKDAQTAVNKAETLDNFSEELAQGKVTTIIQAVKEEDPEAYNILVDGYLDQLHDVDKGAYYHVVGNVIKRTIMAMGKSEDGDTKIAAAILNKFVFNTEEFEPPQNLSTRPKEKDERETNLDKREQEFRQNQLDTHTNSINSRIDNLVKSAITNNIDPKQSMTEFTRGQAVKVCTSQLQEAIDKDTRFGKILDQLWEKAAEKNFSAESLDRIKNAYWSKAKGLLPDIIRKTRNEALKGQGHKSPNERREPLPVGRPTSGKKEETNRQPNRSGMTDKEKARALPKGTKSLDYLMKD